MRSGVLASIQNTPQKLSYLMNEKIYGIEVVKGSKVTYLSRLSSANLEQN